MMPRVEVCPEADPPLLPMACGRSQHRELTSGVRVQQYSTGHRSGSLEKGCISERAQNEKQPCRARVELDGRPRGLLSNTEGACLAYLREVF